MDFSDKWEWERLCSNNYIQISYNHKNKKLFMEFNCDDCYISHFDLLALSEEFANALRHMNGIKHTEKYSEQ